MQRTMLLRWLLKRLKPREFDSNKEAAGSLLALLLQTHPPNAQALADINGIDALLQVHPVVLHLLGPVGLRPTSIVPPCCSDAFMCFLPLLFVQRRPS